MTDNAYLKINLREILQNHLAVTLHNFVRTFRKLPELLVVEGLVVSTFRVATC